MSALCNRESGICVGRVTGQKKTVFSVRSVPRCYASERAPKKKKRQDSNFEKKISGQKSQIGLDTKTYWLTDRQL
jgi:hypothetical protein